MPFHAARIHTSDRLRRVHALLADGAEHTSFEIQTNARVCAPGTVVSELRANGAEIVCRVQHLPGEGRRFFYRMVTACPDPADA